MNLEGEIGEIQLIDRLVDLWRQKFTGAIRFENDGIIKIIYVKGGDVLSASTNDRNDSVDEILMRAGKVSREHVKQALAKRKENETLGEALLHLGFVTRKELTWARRMQVISVIRSIEGWSSGSFTIVADYLPKREDGTVFPLPQLIVELIVTEQDRSRFEQALDGGSAVFERSASFDSEFRALGLNDEAAQIAAQIDGTRNASEIAAAARTDVFNTYKLLHGLATLGFLHKRGSLDTAADEISLPAAGTTNSFDDFSFETAGVADAADAFSVSAAPEPDVPVAVPPVLEAAVEPSIEEPAGWTAPEPMVVPPVTSRAAEIAPPSAGRVRKSEPLPGFDEAQIETARRFSETHRPEAKRAPARPAKAKSRSGLLIALLAVVLLAGAAYGGWMWWQSRETGRGDEVAHAPSPPATTSAPAATETDAPAPQPTDTGTIVEIPTTGSATSSALATKPPVTATVAPPATQPAEVASTPQRARYLDMAQRAAANPQGNFAIQLAIVCQESNVDKAMRAGGEQVWLLPISVRGQACFRLMYGHYQSREAATAAVASELPRVLREDGAVPVPIPR